MCTGPGAAHAARESLKIGNKRSLASASLGVSSSGEGMVSTLSRLQLPRHIHGLVQTFNTLFLPHLPSTIYPTIAKPSTRNTTPCYVML